MKDLDALIQIALQGGSFATPSSEHEAKIRQWLETHERDFRAQKNAAGELELSIFDVIGDTWWTDGVSTKSVKQKLDAYRDVTVIRVLIDSPGGNAFDGIAIQTLLKRHAARVEVEVVGEASSAASVIAMGGDTISMHEGSMMMVHAASVGIFGNAKAHRHWADMLDKLTTSIVDIYETRTGKARAEVESLVEAETWMTAKEAVELGFADALISGRVRASTKKPENRAQPKSATAIAPTIQLTAEEAEHIAARRLARLKSQPLAKASRGKPPPLGGFKS